MKKFKKGDIVRHIGWGGEPSMTSVGVVVGYGKKSDSGHRIVNVAFCFDGSFLGVKGMVARVGTYPEECLSIYGEK